MHAQQQYDQRHVGDGDGQDTHGVSQCAAATNDERLAASVVTVMTTCTRQTT
jgi:hypothetical protein